MKASEFKEEEIDGFFLSDLEPRSSRTQSMYGGVKGMVTSHAYYDTSKFENIVKVSDHKFKCHFSSILSL